MKQVNLLVHTVFISGKLDHAFLRHRQFIIWPWNFTVKVSAELKKNVLVNLVAMLMAKTYSKYGTNTYISIFPFYLRPYFNVKFTMKHSGHLWAYFSTQILSYCHKCLASNLESYFVSKNDSSNSNISITMIVYHIWSDMCFWSLWDWGTNSRFFLIVINCQTTIDMSFLNTHTLCYKSIV